MINLVSCDEVGRGCLAGPIVGCSVKINITTIKKLSLYFEQFENKNIKLIK